MNKPEIRIIENQSETTQNVDVSMSERIALLSKYGYKSSETSNDSTSDNTERGGLTFEEMIAQHEERNYQRQLLMKKENIQSYSIERERVQFHDTKYSTFDDNDSYGFEIKIVSDMKIPKY